jgi:gliding motility-associated-like protein
MLAIFYCSLIKQKHHVRISSYILFLLFTSWLNVSAQEAVYIPPNSLIFIGGSQPVSAFGHFINDGNVSITTGGKLYFLGKIFKNNSKALLTDGSTIKNSKGAGTVIFQQPNPVYGNLGQQIVEAGFQDNISQGPSFSSININNANGIWMVSDMNVLDAVNFQNGHVYTNKYVAALGDSTSYGGVNGFNENRFFVTGNGVSGGYLKISSLESCCIVTYPVGPNNKTYTPIQMRNTGAKNDFYVRAFENVYTNAVSGTVLADTTLKVTWAIAAGKTGTTDVEVLVQNDKDVETNTFTAYRDKSYISLFRNNTWDKLGTFATPQTPGTITSSAAIYTALMNFRKITINSISAGYTTYITKRVVPTKQKYLIPNAFSPNGDGINDVWNLPFITSYRKCVVQIFDRYGRLLFTSYGYQKPWDGTFNGKPLNVGTYYYVIDLKNGEAPIGGYVVLLK